VAIALGTVLLVLALAVNLMLLALAGWGRRDSPRRGSRRPITS